MPKNHQPLQPPLEPPGEKNVHRLEPLTTSEDFSVLADAFGTPYCFWLLGGAPGRWRRQA
ncbi:hypothetical protein D9B87_01385 [Corynebacterium diphtheriae]|nr:hypothetical protein D9B87_01385 [Corynebacterium diphtheriae]